ncbi:hypothetical protein RNZ50_19145 [Paracoccaceae bacterium Fryx2]|nr:hypothetical protein [Paracoccaceae bacterium Fryx2]
MENAVLSNANRVPVNLPGGNDHPVVDLPFTAVIDGRQFRGRGLSLVAAYVSGLMDPAAINATRIVRLMFQFDGFAVTLVVDAEVREGAHGSGEAELLFASPTGPHLPQLRHILNAYISGDLVGLGQTIGVAGTAAPKGPKAAGAPESRMSLRRVAGGAGVGLVSLALIAVAGTLTYQRTFVSLVPSLGTVISTGEVLRATTTGQIVFLDLNAARDDVAVAIQSASGDVQSLVMPCDCVVTSNGLREGSTVLIGEPVLQLASDSDRRLVAAAIPPAMLFDLAGADRIELTFPGGQTALATAEPQGPAVAGADAQLILLRPDVPLDAGRVGQPVQVRILRGSGGLGTWANTARARLVTIFKGV